MLDLLDYSLKFNINIPGLSDENSKNYLSLPIQSLMCLDQYSESALDERLNDFERYLSKISEEYNTIKNSHLGL